MHNPVLSLWRNLQLALGPLWPRYKVAPSNDLESSCFIQDLHLCFSGHSHLTLPVCPTNKRHTSSTNPMAAFPQCQMSPQVPDMALLPKRQTGIPSPYWANSPHGNALPFGRGKGTWKEPIWLFFMSQHMLYTGWKITIGAVKTCWEH